ncbi:hypothetical protein [Erwinia phyllosphaerae]|uniref:hypothetical protein n=1 Tax=Erwinia phyllosphaerae TaxID=2853256 RepID=UPI001FEEE3BA|nr:hypothetical protein [Erwinia phyllosphaerae]MBV4365907.1 hypothetical protein [Erwinia phyllosphaerae]
MINLHHSPVIGGATARGLWVPGALSLGNLRGTANIINLLAQTLDSRVTYTGPSHSYISSDGSLKQSTANVWPLEYKSGVPVGRHDPESAATNYVPGVEYGNVGPTGSTAYDWNYGSSVPTVMQSDMGIASAVSSTASSLTAVYSEGTSAFIAAATDGGSPAAWTLIKRQFTNSASALLRWYVARASSSDYLLARCSGVPAGSFTASVYRKVTSDGLLSAGAQLESGSIVSSPMISPTGQQLTRAASTVVISKYGSASSVVIYYSNGDTQTLSFGSASTVTVPVSALDWGTRYMTHIEYKA